MDKKMESTRMGHMSGCQNYGPFWGTLNVTAHVALQAPDFRISFSSVYS